MLKLIALCFTSVLLLTVSASSHAEPSAQGTWPYYALLQTSIRDYFVIYGEWPQTWQAVREAGLFTAQTVTADGSVIDPDDNSLDFAGDIIYTYHGQEQPEITVWSVERGEKLIAARRVPLVKGGKSQQTSVDALHLQLLGNMFRAVGSFADKQDRLPESWAEFIDSGVTPIDSSSINPLTGQPYAGKGAPGDFLFETRKNGADKVEVRVQWVGLEGRAVNFGGTWFSMPEEEQRPNRTFLKLIP